MRPSLSPSSWLIIGLMLLVAAVMAPVAIAQVAPSKSQELNVAVREVAPFVIKKDGKLDGFSIDLWNALAGITGIKTAYKEKDQLKDLLDAVEMKEVDLAIAAISITAAREEKFDFSQPMFDAGLQIMVRSDGTDSLFNVSALKDMLTSGPMPALLALLALLIVVPAHVVWFAERSHAKSIVDKRYFPGIFHAIWWATGAAHGQQLDYPRSAAGRFISAISIFTSVVFIAFFTASLTSSLTLQQLRGDINGPDDLPGKKVATVTGSTAAAYLRASTIVPTVTPNINDAIQQLLDKKVDAVVYDAPVLLYFAANEGKSKVNVVGSVFKREAYGILFAQDSPWRKPVNEALLKLREDGTYDVLYRKWFQRGEAK